MRVGEFTLPEGLVAAIESGRWPRNSQEANLQNISSLVPEERIRLLAPEDTRLYLYPPPFGLVAGILTRPNEVFYRRFGAVDQIVPEATIEIGDFGLGSDAPIALDYRNGLAEPRVIRLRWAGGGTKNCWVEMAPNFGVFADTLGI